MIYCFSLSPFAGFNDKIPGYPRYSMGGDHGAGQFNLRIQNASIDDDAEFQCQVGPAKNEQPLRTSANLTVICEYSTYIYPNIQIEVRTGTTL